MRFINVFLFSTISLAATPVCVLVCDSNTSRPSSCQTTDVTCLCASSSFQTALHSCFQSTCSTPAEVSTAMKVTKVTCDALGSKNNTGSSPDQSNQPVITGDSQSENAGSTSPTYKSSTSNSKDQLNYGLATVSLGMIAILSLLEKYY